MTATAVRIIQLEKEKNGRLLDNSKEELDSFFSEIADKRVKDRIGYVTRAFRQKGKLDHQIKKLKKRAKDAGLSIYKIGKGKEEQLVLYNSKDEGSVYAVRKLARTLKGTKSMSLPRVTKKTSQKIKKMSEKLNSMKNKKRGIDKKHPKKTNTTKTAKNKNIQGLKGVTEKRKLRKKPNNLPN